MLCEEKPKRKKEYAKLKETLRNRVSRFDFKVSVEPEGGEDLVPPYRTRQRLSEVLDGLRRKGVLDTDENGPYF